MCSLPLVSGQGRESKTYKTKELPGRAKCYGRPPVAGAAKCPAISQVHQGKSEYTPWPMTVRGASTDPPCWWHEACSSLSREGRSPSELPMLLVRGPENARSH